MNSVNVVVLVTFSFSNTPIIIIIITIIFPLKTMYFVWKIRLIPE